MPCVTTWRGGSSRSPKKRALSARVRPVSVFRRVREPRDDEGSLNADVAVGADAEQLQVDAARRGDVRLVRVAGREQVGRVDVGAAHRVGGEVDLAGQLALDDGAIALRMAGRQADVLVQQEAAGARAKETSPRRWRSMSSR